MKSFRIVSFFAVLVFVSFFAGILQAENGTIKKIEFEKLGDQNEAINFHLDGPWIPKVFVLKGVNPRVVFDFMDTGLAKAVPASLNTKGDMVAKVRMGRYSNKTRVVLDLSVDIETNFDQHYDEITNILTISVFSAAYPEKQKTEVIVVAKTPVEEVVANNKAVAIEQNQEEVVQQTEAVDHVENLPSPAEAAAVAEEGPAVDPLLYEVSFEDASDKGEMVLFKLNGFYPPLVKGEEEGTPVVHCDFAGTRLAEEVIAEKLVKGKYIEKILVKKLDDLDLVRVTLELTPNNNYDLQQVFFKEDNLFVIIVNTYDALSKKAE